MRNGTNVVPRPFLKWVGGKGQLLGELRARIGKAGAFKRYHEPFVGGGALFFELYRSEQLGRTKAFLSDNNPRLMAAYMGIQENVERVILLLKVHAAKHCKEHYYEVRANVPGGLCEDAARVIYLNKTCFNGLFRENSRGEFNVPMGKYKNPLICDEMNLRAVATALSHAKIEQRPFDSVLDRVQAGDLVYFDPPYHPVSKTSSFTSYDKGGFGEQEQRNLAEVFRKLDKQGAKVLLSNSDTPLIQELYRGYQVDQVYASRTVNSRADRRGKVTEALVRNF